MSSPIPSTASKRKEIVLPQTIQYLEGDGKADDFFNVAVLLPDTGSSMQVAGTVQIAGGTPFSIPLTTLTAPAPPATGSIYYNVQVDGTTGTPTLQQSTTAPPPAINANNRIVFSQTITSTSTDLALAGNDATPDPALGAP